MSTFRSPARPRLTPASFSGNEPVPLPAAARHTVATAMAYADCGWPVFPCRPGSKEPATRHGFHDATTDPGQIRTWWARWPDANLAIATGAPGPDVLDVDEHGRAGNGFAALLQLKQAGVLDQAGTTVHTPHGGLHLYFTGSAQACGRLPRLHLDFKAAGGYVLAPPSRVDGRPYYVFTEPGEPGHLDWQQATRILDPQPGRPARQLSASGDPGRLAAWVERLQEGNRNAGLFWAACRAVESGQADALDEIAAAAAKTGLDQREIARTIASARRGAGRQGDREATR